MIHIEGTGRKQATPPKQQEVMDQTLDPTIIQGYYCHLGIKIHN